MFKLNKYKSVKSREKFDFKFYNFQALQVPKGWDKLFISLVSIETGKTISKLGKASVRNGTCRWTDTLSESVYIPQDDSSVNDLECCFFKFVVAMGSSRSGILGEVAINIADYTSSRTSVPLSLQLKKCNYSTSLQFKVQCLNPQTKHRAAQSKETDLHIDYGSSDQDDMERKSDASDGAFSRSAASNSGNHLDSASMLQVVFSRDPSLSASDSRRSFDSVEVSSGKDTFSPQNNPGSTNLIGTQDSTDSQNGGQSDNSSHDDNQSNHSYLHSRVPDISSPYGHEKKTNSSAFMSSPFLNTGSKDLLEAAEIKIEELRAEARMWERNAKRLMGDVDVLKEELSEQSKCQETLNMELSASLQESNDLKLEIEHLKCLLEELSKKHDIGEDFNHQARDKNAMQQEMEKEIGFLKESNVDLTEQLQKTQESNVELLSILQELEGIVETQKLEIETLKQVGQTTAYRDVQFPDSIDNIKLQLQQLQETQEELEGAIKLLEKTVEEKDNEIEMERELRMQSLLDTETEWSYKLANKDEEIRNLKEKLSEAVNEWQNKILEVEAEGETELVKEIQFLRGKVEDLEKDCNELTQENLELVLELREPRKDSLLSDAFIGLSCGNPDDNSTCKCGKEVDELRAQLEEVKQELRNKEALIEDAANFSRSQVQCQELEDKCTDLEIQLQCFKQKAAYLEDEVQKFHAIVSERQVELHSLQQQLNICKEKETENTYGEARGELWHCNKFVNSNGYTNCTSAEELEKSDIVISSDSSNKLQEKASKTETFKSDHLRQEEENEVLRKQLFTLQNQISTLRDKNHLLEETIESLEREKTTSSNCLEELRKEIVMLQSSVDSHVSANKVLERMSSELERGKEDLEQQLSDLEKENMQLSERVSALEAQLRYLTNEKETCHLELRHSECQVSNLRDEIRRLEMETEAHKHDMKQKLQDMKNRWLEAQEECEYLKKANPKLQATAEKLIIECSSLQKLNGELKQQNIELHTSCSVLESQLRDYHGKFSECSGKIEALEMEFFTMTEELSLKEKSHKSELDSLIIENREHQEKLGQENLSLNLMYLQKVVEVENLQRELAHLIEQISFAPDEQESVTSDALLEISVLRADKAKLESSLQELQAKVTLYESKLSKLEIESEEKMQELMASRQNLQILMADHDKLSAILESFKGNEEKHKSIVNGFEMKLRASDYERLQLGKEISSLKEQLQRETLLQDEVLALKTSLNDAKFEYEKTKASLDIVYADHEELKNEKDYLVQKISSMEKALSELEGCQRSKVALEEKVLRLEGDLTAREALCAQDAELKIELNRVKRANGELQRKIKHHEQDQKETAEALEEQLKHKKDKVNASDLDNDSIDTVSSNGEERQLLGNPEQQNTDYLSKIHALENELAEALEANNMYKAQLRRFLSEEESRADSSKLSSIENELDVRRNGSSMSTLETELRDLQERYFQMSLKYAEVEAQREELVMKLKTTNNRSWFS